MSDDITSMPPARSDDAPVTEADLHAYVDARLSVERRQVVDAHLARSPEARGRVDDWRRQNDQLRNWLAPVLDEPVPLRMVRAPRGPIGDWRALAAGLFIALVSAGSAWWARGAVDATGRTRFAAASLAVPADGGTSSTELTGFARRAAVAHAVYSPEVRRPVEVGVEQEQALTTWLTKRLGAPVHAPSLSSVGYDLIGGRLLPGDASPVAQFMYGSATGERLTLYVSREVAGNDTAFKFGHDGPVHVFYWVEGPFGYAISAGADRATLLKVSQEVYRQLKPG